jgi:prepilin-type N-terminal cleavage/methylation domain-containing protein
MDMANIKQYGFTIIELMFAMMIFSAILIAASAGIIQVGRMYYKGVTITRTQSAARQIVDDIARPIQFSGKAPIINTVGASFGSGAGQIQAYALCVGSTRYSYVLDAQVDPTVASGSYAGGPAATTTHKIRHALWRDEMSVAATTAAQCPPLDLRSASPLDSSEALPALRSDGTEMVGANMRLDRLCVATPPSSPPACGGGVAAGANLYQVDAWVVYGDYDLLDRTSYTDHIVCNGGFLGTQFCALSQINTVVSRRLR